MRCLAPSICASHIGKRKNGIVGHRARQCHVVRVCGHYLVGIAQDVACHFNLNLILWHVNRLAVDVKLLLCHRLKLLNVVGG